MIAGHLVSEAAGARDYREAGPSTPLKYAPLRMTGLFLQRT
jgi:hypothetical protein